MKPLTEADIRSSFVNATPDELAQLPIPGLHEMLWDEREFLGWRDPQAARRGYFGRRNAQVEVDVGIHAQQ